MVWTELTRAQHKRKTARYPSDLTAEEWLDYMDVHEMWNDTPLGLDDLAE